MKTLSSIGRKATRISNGMFLILLSIIFYTGAWWPGLLLAVGITLALRQYLTGRKKELLITLVIIGFICLTAFSFSILMPLLLAGCGIYMIGREYFLQDRLEIEKKQSI